jgi:hypothetical protein
MDHIIAAGAYVRTAWTATVGPDAGMVNVHTTSVIGIFAPAKNTLPDHRARWIRDSFQYGLQKLNQTLSEGKGEGETLRG